MNRPLPPAIDYRFLPLERLLRDCQARQSVPGGGCVSALAGALGATMALMAANYSTGKKYAAVAAEIQAILERLAAVERDLTDLMLADQQAFLALQVAYQDKSPSLPAVSEQAARVPLRMVERAAAALEDCARLAVIGNPNLFSDVVVAAILLEAAARAAALNVRVNLPALDAANAHTLRQQLEHGLQQAQNHLHSVQSALAAKGW